MPLQHGASMTSPVQRLGSGLSCPTANHRPQENMFRRSTLDPMDMRTYSARLRANINATKEQMRHFSSEEQGWRDRFTYLQRKGYTLRRRFNPALPHSWDIPGYENVDPNMFEDWIPSEVGAVS